MNRWETYFQDLLNTTTAECYISHNNAHTNETETKQEVENDPPDILDTEIAIRSVRNNKAPGTGNIHIKPYKKGGQLLINMLHSLIKRRQIEEKVPTVWKTNIIVPIWKKRVTKLRYHNYTGISILCT